MTDTKRPLHAADIRPSGPGVRAILAVNCNCFTNRWTEPAEWTRLCAEELGVDTVQYCIDLLDPYYPWDLQRRIMDETLEAANRYGVTLRSSFGGHHSHQHYLGHPDAEVRAESERWFRRCIDQTAYLGADGFGTCFAIMTVADNADPARRGFIMEEAKSAYRRLGEHAAEKGLAYLSFETTSVPRESCATIAETRTVLEDLGDMAVPMRLCLDVGHRNLGSDDPQDADPLAWITALGAHAAAVHIQQTDNSASCHWPFTKDKNSQGIVEPAAILDAVLASCRGDVLLPLEVGAKAFYPSEYTYLDALKESVNHWRSAMGGKTWMASETARTSS